MLQKKKSELKKIPAPFGGEVLEGPMGVEEPKERGTLKSAPQVFKAGGSCWTSSSNSRLSDALPVLNEAKLQ